MKNNSKKINLWQGNGKSGGRSAGAIVVWGLLFALLAYVSTALILHGGDDGSKDCGVVFSEVMTANSAAYPAQDGGFYDWVELKNVSDEAVELTGLKIANTFDSRSAFALPSMTLGAGERTLVYCTGAENLARMYAGFTLDKDGDSLYLFDAKGNILQYLQVPALGKGEVYMRDEASGEWSKSAFFTPLLENTQAAHESLAQKVVPGALEISELMASNGETLQDADGDAPDWIEIHNTSGETVSLSGWSLTTDIRNRRRWSFPNAQIAADGYLVVFASGKSGVEGELHASFKLSATGETLYLIDPMGQIASVMQYDSLAKDQSLSRSGAGVTTGLAPSPGYENTSYGATLALGNAWRTAHTNAEGVYINEVICQMATYSDWVELYNANDYAVDLSGWWLSDSVEHPRKWEFPAGTYLQAGEYKVLFLNGGEVNPNDPAGLTVDFALSISKNETLVLSRPDGTAVDSMALKAQKSQVSYGRADGYGEYRWFTTPTPGAANTGASYGGSAACVEFSRSGGRVENGAFELTLSSPDGLPIYYTTDGSDPVAASNRYSGPIPISQTTVVKAVAWSDDYLPSDAVANTYIFETTGDLRLVCVSGDRSALNAGGGVLNTGAKVDVPTYVEVYDYDGSLMLSQGCELTLSGRSSRTTFAQKAFRLTAKSVYGSALFHSKLFTQREYTAFNSFVMRASGQDCLRSHMVDSLLTSLAADTGVFYQETELAEVYVNGNYWGVYNMRERVDATTIANFEGWENPDAIDLVESSGLYAVQGSSQNIRQVMQFVHASDLSDPQNLATLRQYVDVENYLDYVALQIYTANEDLNNVRIYRNTEGDGKWRWVLYDLDLAYRNDKNSVNMWLKGGDVGSVTTQDGEMFSKLMRNDEMRDYFLARFGELLANEFSTEHVYGLIVDRYNAICDEMKNNCARWDWSYSTWQKHVKNIATYSETRPARLVEFCRNSFGLSDAEVEHYFGAAIEKINAYSAEKQ